MLIQDKLSKLNKVFLSKFPIIFKSNYSGVHFITDIFLFHYCFSLSFMWRVRCCLEWSWILFLSCRQFIRLARNIKCFKENLNGVVLNFTIELYYNRIFNWLFPESPLWVTLENIHESEQIYKASWKNLVIQQKHLCRQEINYY